MPAPSLRDRFQIFIAEQFPFAGAVAATAWDRAVKREPESADDVEQLRVPMARALRSVLAWPKLPAGAETTPGVTVRERLDQAGRGAGRGVRRIPPARSDRAQPDPRRTARDPARHDSDARDRHPAQELLQRIGSEARQARRFQGKGSGRWGRRRSMRRRSASSAARRTVAPTDRGRAM